MTLLYNYCFTAVFENEFFNKKAIAHLMNDKYGADVMQLIFHQYGSIILRNNWKPK